jgi:hypothetical protein
MAASNAADTADSEAVAESTAFMDHGKLVFRSPETWAR